jgi:hypothetical protein
MTLRRGCREVSAAATTTAIRSVVPFPYNPATWAAAVAAATSSSGAGDRGIILGLGHDRYDRALQRDNYDGRSYCLTEECSRGGSCCLMKVRGDIGTRAKRRASRGSASTSVSREGRECARHRHFRALGPFGARLITPKLTLSDLRQRHERS